MFDYDEMSSRRNGDNALDYDEMQFRDMGGEDASYSEMGEPSADWERWFDENFR
jgi:hypothetical protein